MKITLSVIKADVGSVGGHNIPSMKLISAIENHVKKSASRLLIDYKIFHTGDDTAIVMSKQSINHPDIHKLAFEAFEAGTEAAKSQGLYERVRTFSRLRFQETSGEWDRDRVRWSLKNVRQNLLSFLPVTRLILEHLITRF